VVTRRPGQFLEERVRKTVIDGVKVLAIGVPFVILGFVWWPFSVVALVPMGCLLYLQRRGRRLDWTNDDKGLVGERQVGALLESLTPTVLVLHDLDIGWGNADHVAIAPTGVFAIEVKNWRGRFFKKRGHLMFNEEACRVHDALATAGFDVFVQAVLVSTNASVMTDGFEVGKVKVVPLSRVEDLLSAGPQRLTATQQVRIRAALLIDGPIVTTNVSWE
jgi:hypothetical protein